MEKEQGLLQSVKVNIIGVIIILRELSLKKERKKKEVELRLENLNEELEGTKWAAK